MNWTFLLVAIVYFGAVFLWRRWASSFPWAVAFVFYGAVLVFLFEPLTQNAVNLPADFLLELYPWKILGHRTELNSELNDLILQIVPWSNLVRESWRNLEVPLWNAASGGYPLLANGQSSALSPLRLLGLPLDLGQSFSFEAAVKLLIALSFTFLYCRRRWSVAASVIAALSFGFSTFLVVWLNFPMATVAAFLPAVFLAVDLLLERYSYRRFVFCSGVFAMLLFNGHPETAAHNVFAAILYVVFWQVTSGDRQRWRKPLRIAAAGVVGFILSLPAILPIIEAIPYSKRYEQLQVYGNPGMKVSDARFLVPFIQVGFYGTLREKNLWGPGIAEVISGYTGVLAVTAWLAMTFAVARRRQWRSREGFFVLASPAVLGIVLGWPGLSHLFHALPVFSLAANGRLRLVLCFFLSALLAAMVDAAKNRENHRTIFVSLAMTLALLVLPFLLNEFPSDRAFDHSVTTTLPGLLALSAAAAFVFFQRGSRGSSPVSTGPDGEGRNSELEMVSSRGSSEGSGWGSSHGESSPSEGVGPPPGSLAAARDDTFETRTNPASFAAPPWAVAMLGVAVITDLWSFGYRWNPVMSADLLYPTTPLIEALKKKRMDFSPASMQPFRVAGSISTFFPNSAAMFGLEDIRSHDPMAFGRYLGALRVFTGYTSTDYFGILKDFEHPYFDYLNVRFIITSDLENYTSDRFTEIYSGKDGKIYENRSALPRFFAPRNVLVEFDDAKRIERILQNRDYADTVVVKRLPMYLMNDQKIRFDVLRGRPAEEIPAKIAIRKASSREFDLDITTTKWTLIISSQPHWPGWRIYRGDERLKMIEVNAAFMAFIVPPGHSDIRIEYVPRSFYVSAQVSIVAALLLAFWPAISRRSRGLFGRTG